MLEIKIVSHNLKFDSVQSRNRVEYQNLLCSLAKLTYLNDFFLRKIRVYCLQMFALVRPMHDRFALRLKEDDNHFLIYIDGTWQKLETRVFANHAAVLKGLDQGKRIVFSSHRITNQRVLLICFPAP